MNYTIGIDVGGTKIAGGIVDSEGKIVSRVRRSAPAQDSDLMLAAIAAVIKELSAQQETTGVGIALAGFMDKERNRMRLSPNVAWRDIEIRSAIESKVGKPVIIENDANAAAWGEFRFGGGAEADSMVMLTIGTGLGSGVIIDGQLLIGAHGIGAECGHFKVKPDGQLCGCGQRGCLEQYASGQAITRNARVFVASGTPAAQPLLDACGQDPTTLTGAMVTETAQKGDPASISILAEAGKWLGFGMSTIAAILDPEMFVVGGGGGDAGELILAPARVEFELKLPAREHRPIAKITAATLGNDAGIIGAADLARKL